MAGQDRCSDRDDRGSAAASARGHGRGHPDGDGGDNHLFRARSTSVGGLQHGAGSRARRSLAAGGCRPRAGRVRPRAMPSRRASRDAGRPARRGRLDPWWTPGLLRALACGKRSLRRTAARLTDRSRGRDDDARPGPSAQPRSPHLLRLAVRLGDGMASDWCHQTDRRPSAGVAPTAAIGGAFAVASWPPTFRGGPRIERRYPWRSRVPTGGRSPIRPLGPHATARHAGGP